MTPREAARAAVAAQLRGRFGVPVWWGHHTCRWWAMLTDGGESRLVEAADPRELAEAIIRAQAWPQARRARGGPAAGAA